MVNTLHDAISQLGAVHILVIGDFLLDVYTTGEVNRISPEAPVPVLLVSDTRKLPGGAGNVALNLKALGADVSVIGRIGDDDGGRSLVQALEESGITADGLCKQERYQTPLKNRLVAGGQQLIRADYERMESLSKEAEDEMLTQLDQKLEESDLVAVSDYGKGGLSDSFLEELFLRAERKGKKVIVDPKGKEFRKYSGAFLIKPNHKEAYQAAEMPLSAPLEAVAEKIFTSVETKHVLVTRSEKGMTLFSHTLARQDFEVEKKDVLDVTGAGDTALSVIAFSVANGLSLESGIELANIASGLTIEKLGCVAVKLSEIIERFLHRNPTHKIFYENAYPFVLEKALQDQPILLLKLQREEEISSEMIHRIRELARDKGEKKLVIHIECHEDNQDMIHLLASLYEVDLILGVASGDHPFLSKAHIEETVLYEPLMV